MKTFRLAFLFGVLTMMLSNCTTTERTYVTRTHYVHDAEPAPTYNVSRSWWNLTPLSYPISYQAHEDSTDPAHFKVVNSYDRD